MTDKQQDVAFLAETFDIPARKAANLVAANPEEAEALATAELKHERNSDPLEGVPVPASPEEHEVEGNGGMQKTVVHRNNEASRIGP